MPLRVCQVLDIATMVVLPGFAAHNYGPCHINCMHYARTLLEKLGMVLPEQFERLPDALRRTARVRELPPLAVEARTRMGTAHAVIHFQAMSLPLASSPAKGGLRPHAATVRLAILSQEPRVRFLSVIVWLLEFRSYACAHRNFICPCSHHESLNPS